MRRRGDVLELRTGICDISPGTAVGMGCGSECPTAELRDRLEANAVFLRCGTSEALLISVDCLYVGPKLRRVVEEAVAGRLEPEAIFLTASHSHAAPMLDHSKPRLGTVGQEHFVRVSESIADLARQLTDGSAMQRVKGTFVEYRTSAPINRRRRRFVTGARGRLRVRAVGNAPGPERFDHYASAIVLVDTCGRPKALIWQLPCHPTSLPEQGRHSAHFPGEIRRRFRREHGHDIPCVFLQGFSGDLRPPSVATPRGLRQRVRRVALGRWFGSFSEEEYATWCDQIYQELRDGIVAAAPRNVEHLSTRRIERPMRTFARGPGVQERSMTCHLVQLGETSLLGVSAEVVSDYAEWLRCEYPHLHIVPVGCMDDPFGYAPTARMVRDGGYEADGFFDFFGVSQLSPNLEADLRQLMGAALTHRSIPE